MTTGMIKWTTGIVMGLSLFTAGCNEKKSDGDTSQSRVEGAPSSAPEATEPEKSSTSSSASQQNPSGPNKDQNQETGRKS